MIMQSCKSSRSSAPTNVPFFYTGPLETHTQPANKSINHTDVNTPKHPFITAELDYKHLAFDHSGQTHTHTPIYTPSPSAPRRAIHTLEEGASIPITPQKGEGGVSVCVFAEGAHKSAGD